MTEQPNREVAVLNAALELPAGERADYLDKACADDTGLREKVEALLLAHEQAEYFLEAPPTGVDFKKIASPNVPLTEKPGDKIGRYKLLQQIGEGGCGVVYMAEQEEPVRRRVALKVIKLGMDTKQVIARFEAERQALALMEHPNIARVLDAGATDAGRPYFVMELVRGVKITEFCDENKLPTADRLKLFIQVCQAIQHAHQKGIIHRDIKPSNILVTINDGVPVPKVIDFGIAKATAGRLTDQTLFTAFEQFIGTPAYMSPEQAVMTSLDIDTRSDIYSLGVLLYELLTGRTPFDSKELLAAGLDEMRRTIRESEPPRPSTRLSTLAADALTTAAKHRHTDAPKLIHLLRGDLDWIVMKCLEKDRARRYDTAIGLARDIERHLNNEPIAASPPSKLYEFQKTVRRHKFGFAAAALLITVLAIGVIVSTTEAIRATRAEREQSRLTEAAQRAQANEARLRREAEADKRKAETEAAKSQQVAQFLTDILSGTDPDNASGLDTTLLQRILDNTVARVTSELSTQPEVQGRLLSVSGWAYAQMGAREKAETALRQALKIQRQVLPVPHPDLADTLNSLAKVVADSGQVAEAESLMRESLELRRKLYGNEHLSVADCLNNLSGPLSAQGKLDEAESVLREALAIKRKLFPDGDASVAISLRDLGLQLRSEGKPAETLGLLQESLAMFKRTLGDSHSQVFFTLQKMKPVLIEQGKFAEMKDCERETLQIKVKLFGKHDARGLAASGELQARLGHFAEAALDYARLSELQPEDYEAWHYRAIALFASGQLEAYRDVSHQSLQRLANTTNFDAGDWIGKAGLVLPCSGPDLEAAARMIGIAARANSNHQYSAWFRFGKGLAEYRLGHYGSAVAWMEQVLAQAGTTPERDTAAWFVLAMAQNQLKRTDNARFSMSKGRDTLDANMPKLSGVDLGGNWDDWVVAHALRREAEALIEGQTNSAAEKNSGSH